MRVTYTIERGRGATYHNNDFVVYQHDVYPRNSVLAGQHRRTWKESYTTLEEAKTAWPTAKVIAGTTYAPPDLSHLPEEDY